MTLATMSRSIVAAWVEAFGRVVGVAEDTCTARSTLRKNAGGKLNGTSGPAGGQIGGADLPRFRQERTSAVRYRSRKPVPSASFASSTNS